MEQKGEPLALPQSSWTLISQKTLVASPGESGPLPGLSRAVAPTMACCPHKTSRGRWHHTGLSHQGLRLSCVAQVGTQAEVGSEVKGQDQPSISWK